MFQYVFPNVFVPNFHFFSCFILLTKLKIALRTNKLAIKLITIIIILITIILTGFKKQPIIKKSYFFLSFSFLVDSCMSFFPFLSFSKSEFYRQAFIVNKNGDNWKLLIEMFGQKLIGSNVILLFLHYLKPKFFFVIQSWWPKYSILLFKMSESSSSSVIHWVSQKILVPKHLFAHYNLLLKQHFYLLFLFVFYSCYWCYMPIL